MDQDDEDGHSHTHTHSHSDGEGYSDEDHFHENEKPEAGAKPEGKSLNKSPTKSGNLNQSSLPDGAEQNPKQVK